MKDNKMWIQNVSKLDIAAGHHFDPGPNAMLIQIMDQGEGFPVPKYKFKEVHQFEFLDIEDDGLTNMGDGIMSDLGEFAITDEQAEDIAALLLHARKNRMNVIVHCYAGIFRSGAVAEVGIELGFDDTDAFRCPNRLVKRKLLQALNLPYKDKESMTINGELTNKTKTGIMIAKARNKDA
jgi:predicted protein tyrosine phosphatase